MSDKKDSKQSGNGVHNGPEEVVVDGNVVKKQLTGTMFMVTPDDNITTAPLNRAALAELYATSQKNDRSERTTTTRVPQPSNAQANLIPLDLPNPYGNQSERPANYHPHDASIAYSQPALRATIITCLAFLGLGLIAYLLGVL